MAEIFFVSLISRTLGMFIDSLDGTLLAVTDDFVEDEDFCCNTTGVK